MELYKCQIYHTKGKEAFDCSNGGLEPYKCHKCNAFATPLLSQLRYHILQGHTSQCVEPTTYKCPSCDFKSFSEFLLSHHLNLTQHQSKDIYKCINCDYKTKFFVSLRKHFLQKHPDIVWFKCEHCPFKGINKNDLRRHLRQNHDPSLRYQCQYCDYKTKKNYTLRRHVITQHELKQKHLPRTLICPKCQFTTPFRHKLNKHVVNKHGPSRFKCEQCEFGTRYKYNLQKHVAVKHTNNPKVLKCQMCEYKPKHKDYLIDHIRTQHGVVPAFECAPCEFKTNVKRSFVRHCRAHNESQKCNECGLSLQNKLELAKHKKLEHLKVSVDVKVHKCQLCDFQSEYPGNVHRHKYNKHLDQWVYCAHCDHKTKRKDSLLEHLRTQHKLALI
ncbi:zinc finger protein 711 [Tribolium castaneum]|uniref:Protein hunchback n=1 Tax=Tribolium castaneum TaxID=7070 RepID=D2A5V6_TRICA|nr:PREDICTED: zinc finger protein 711 [Tribolium castaneum]XP_015836393.1 PREDICTED: zinc finger protein 711 [Tribolium castaneum]EFA05424.2 Zinc finger protein 335-like Protein [Tribolium castaneum]|eukprot:XP_015836392.1 PREDICTED: zinc finger protein 711 [Tribolium castaneum]